MLNNQRHLYHLVDPSPWPLLTAGAGSSTLVGAVMYMHSVQNGFFVLIAGLFTTLFCMGIWWRDVIREGTIECYHTKKVLKGLSMGMILFIVSEIMFFFAFFWSYFYYSFNPGLGIGCSWPPSFLVTVNPFKIPLLNTLLLLTSGASLTWSHHSIVLGDKSQAIIALLSTVSLGIVFSLFQLYEYQAAPFCISDGVYGSVFYMTTGLHGSHVIIGTIFLIVCFYRM